MRRPNRFRPDLADPLEPRRLLSGGPRMPHIRPTPALVHPARHNPGPRTYLNAQYDALLTDFRAAEAAFLSAAGPSPAMAMNVALFTNYVAGRVELMTTNLVTYFNQLPIRLPRIPRLPFTQPPRTAIQVFIQQQLVAGPSNLLASLNALSLSPDLMTANLRLYDATATNLIQASRIATIDGVMQAFAGKMSYTTDPNYGKK